MPFMSLELIFFDKNVSLFCIFSFLSTCYLVLLMRGHIIHYHCSKMVQLDKIGGPKSRFRASEAFSGKF